MIKKILLLAFISICTTGFVAAKAKIPFGKIDKIEIVADLPDTEKYAVSEGSKEYLDLARMHQEYNIAWVIPAWITQEPKLVLAQKDSDEYFELNQEQLAQIVSENKLNQENLLQLGLYTKYGGKLIVLLIIGLILYGIFSKDKPKKVNPTTI
ncbi:MULTISPECIES: hypothetical protein [unclassified Chryseobacterium]|uniref:hypothetical protein n=1 Tax=unclassified Chryseobacterium TaxID=2593645 RepID=UPI00100A56EB|nr:MULTISPECIES: hypothetical protein [unclassified Chryseobacterium]RXM51706.1 hypothetical protein BOQ64_12375 [Chryseobacterium sp. CH25]RXM67284.1 hypothetical protein BOQ60_05100 [Chryseobacterium sp. CH1]